MNHIYIELGGLADPSVMGSTDPRSALCNQFLRTGGTGSWDWGPPLSWITIECVNLGLFRI